MNQILSWLDGLIVTILPQNIYTKMDWLYSGILILLGFGLILVIVAVVLMVLGLRNGRKGDQKSALL